MTERWNGRNSSEILKDGMTDRRKITRNPKRWNGGTVERQKFLRNPKNGMTELRNGGKPSKILKDGIMEWWNAGKYPEILKDGMMERRKFLRNPKRWNKRTAERRKITRNLGSISAALSCPVYVPPRKVPGVERKLLSRTTAGNRAYPES